MQWFHNIAFVSSYQDGYVPFDSARIQICKESLTDTNKGKAYIKMATKILSNLKTNIVYRIDINFNIQDKNLDAFVGRKAHILFLDDQTIMRMLIHRY